MSKSLLDDARESGRLVRTWEHEGIECAMIRSPMIGVNGYVRVPKGIVLDFDNYGDVMLEAHWGITYGPDDDDWIGFDTGHAFDVWLDPDVPEDRYTRTLRELNLDNVSTDLRHMGEMTTIWTLEKLEVAVNDLAVQVLAMKRD